MWRTLLLILLLVGPSLAQSPDPVEQALRQNDAQVLRAYSSRYPADERYNDVLNRITVRLMPKASKIYGQPVERPGDLVLAVHYSNVGFNALAFHRLVLLDTLLLDSLMRLAQGTAVHGTMANQYTDQLARFVAVLSRQGEQALARPHFDPRNPYRIPPPEGLTPELQADANRLFEEMLAAWLTHEISHALLGHTREKWVKASALARQLELADAPPQVVEGLVRQYLDYDLGRAKELEADRYGAMLGKEAGYSPQGYRRVLLFVKRIEEFSGRDKSPLRTHPEPWARWHVIREVFGRSQDSD